MSTTPAQLQQTPSMGRIVHYVDVGGTAYPAIVRAVREGSPDVVDLTAFTDGAPGTPAALPVDGVPHSGRRVVFSWHWPERV